MNNRIRFIKTFKFEECDHPPLFPDGVWDTTIKEWKKQGFPENISLEEFFGIESLKLVYAGPLTGVYPPFEEKVIEEDEEIIIKIDRYGRKVRDFKNHMSMPEWIEFPVKTPQDLKKIIDEKFNPEKIEERWPFDWERKKEKWLKEQKNRDYILFLDGGCYYGHLRNLCGVETTSFLFYDSPQLIEELFERIFYFCEEGIKRIKKAGLVIDYLGFGEDIAYKTSTLISPRIFKKFLFPRYKKIVEMAKSAGIELVLYDSDGNLNPFMEMYFKAGIDTFWPCEVAADMDPVDLRKRYGKRIKMMGGIDKRSVASGKEEIKKEIKRKEKIIKEGGYIPRIDHSVSSDISLENYRYYIETLKEIYGII